MTRVSTLRDRNLVRMRTGRGEVVGGSWEGAWNTPVPWNGPSNAQELFPRVFSPRAIFNCLPVSSPLAPPFSHPPLFAGAGICHRHFTDCFRTFYVSSQRFRLENSNSLSLQTLSLLPCCQGSQRQLAVL